MSATFFYDNSKTIGFLPIQGNFDNEIEQILQTLNWKKINYAPGSKFFVILDDPFTRWTRIVSNTFIDSNHSNFGLNNDNLLDFLLYNKVTCKKFTTLQKKTIVESKIDQYSKIYFIKLDTKLGYRINHFLRDLKIPNQFNNSLQTNQLVNDCMAKLKNFLHVDTNLPYLNKVTQYLEEDYNFINSIEFYAR